MPFKAVKKQVVSKHFAPAVHHGRIDCLSLNRGRPYTNSHPDHGMFYGHMDPGEQTGVKLFFTPMSNNVAAAEPTTVEPSQAETSSSMSLIKVMAVVGTVLVAILAGASYYMSSGPVDVPQPVKSVTSVSADDHAGHASHYHASHASHDHHHSNPQPNVKQVSKVSFFSSKRNVAIFAIVSAAVILLIAGAVTAAVIASMPEEISLPVVDPEPVLDMSPQAVAEREVASIRDTLAENGFLFGASMGMTAIVVVILLLLTVGGLFCLDWSKNKVLAGILVGLVVLAVIVAVVLAFTVDFASYYMRFAVFFVCSAFVTVSGVMGGPIVLGVVLGTLCLITVLTLIIGAVYKTKKDVNPVDYISRKLLLIRRIKSRPIRRFIIIMSILLILVFSVVAVLGTFMVSPLFVALFVVPVIVIITHVVLRVTAPPQLL